MKKVLFLGLFISVLGFAQRDAEPTRVEAFAGSATLRAVLYETDFEAFSLGDVNGQDGWFGQFGNWVIDNSNPFSGTQHITSVSDGFGQTVCITPTVASSTTGESSASARMMLDNNAGVTWEITPQTPSQSVIVTRVFFNGDGTVSVGYDNGGFTLVDIPVTIPNGYFDVAVNVNEATGLFDLFIDGSLVFTGQGFGNIVENIAFISQMEIGGPVCEIDDVQINDTVLNIGVPTLGEWGMIAFLSLFAIAGLIVLRKKS